MAVDNSPFVQEKVTNTVVMLLTVGLSFSFWGIVSYGLLEYAKIKHVSPLYVYIFLFILFGIAFIALMLFFWFRRKNDIISFQPQPNHQPTGLLKRNG